MRSSTISARIASAVALAVTLVTAATSARADDKAEARRRFAAGVARAEAGAYQQAVVEFQRAYQASPNYAVLYNIAEMQRALGDAAAALETFQRYLAEGGAAIPAARRAKVAAAIAAERAKTGALVITVPPLSSELAPVRVLVDDKPVDAGTASGEAAIRVNPGKHKVTAAATGSATVEQEIAVAAGETATVTLTPAAAAAATAIATATATATAPAGGQARPLAAAPAQPPPPAASLSAARGPEAPPPSSLRRNLGLAAAGAGATGLAIAGVSYALARSRRNQAVADGCTAASCTGDAASEYSGARRALTVFNVSAIAGGVLLAGGAFLLFTSPARSASPTPEPARAHALALAPALAPGAGGIAVLGRW